MSQRRGYPNIGGETRRIDVFLQSGHKGLQKEVVISTVNLGLRTQVYLANEKLDLDGTQISKPGPFSIVDPADCVQATSAEDCTCYGKCWVDARRAESTEKSHQVDKTQVLEHLDRGSAIRTRREILGSCS